MGNTNLVIVESPAKAKTIGKYLGPDYQVKASMGHVRDLPKSKLGVDVTTFEPDYQDIKYKEETISELRKAAKDSQRVYLATDPDREGEAISWHLQSVLGVPKEKTCRVTFNEITRKVVTESIASPREIDQNLVDAQQARRILDRIVGYQLSPLLWKKIRRGLSAGRVQSVATRLVVEREEEIRAFVPKEYWSITADLGRIAPNIGAFRAEFYGRDKKMELGNAQEVQEVMDAVKADTFTVRAVKRQDKKRNPAPPFITSTLQQEASRKLNMTPRRTMSVAQQLYEGVDIAGEGTVGLITYMRTDSLRLSEEALASAKTFIEARYGKEYYPEKTRRFKAKDSAQDAHEAIRPSDVNLTPEQLKKDLTSEQYRLYKLIWSRFLACQMAQAVYPLSALHPAPRPVHRGHPHPGPGGKGHWPTLHLRSHHLHHHGPGVCGQGGQTPAAHPPGRSGHGAYEGQILRHCGPRLYCPDGGASGQGGDGRGELEAGAVRLLHRL